METMLLTGFLLPWLTLTATASPYAPRPVFRAGVDIAISIPQYAVPRFAMHSGRLSRQVIWPRKMFANGSTAHFAVVVRNDADRPLEFYDDGNSGGDRTISFSLTSGSRNWIARKQISAYTKNMLQVIRLMPGEVWSREVYFGLPYWKQFYEGKRGIGAVQMQAILTQGPATDPDIWTGTVRSPVVTVYY